MVQMPFRTCKCNFPYTQGMERNRKNSIKVWQGDITSLKVDAIVNAANNSLLGGGGVDGAIHRAAGPGLLAECRTLGGCHTGEAKITKGYNLPAKWVIHTVGSVWHGDPNHEDELLANCYRSCFALVEKHDIGSIAFPAISTGVYGFPLERATKIAVSESISYLSQCRQPLEITFACFSREALEMYKREIASVE